jgi:exoribonuclease-2
LALHQSPVYFHKKGRGRYKAAPEATLKAALAGSKKETAIAGAGCLCGRAEAAQIAGSI